MQNTVDIIIDIGAHMVMRLYICIQLFKASVGTELINITVNSILFQLMLQLLKLTTEEKNRIAADLASVDIQRGFPKCTFH